MPPAVCSAPSEGGSPRRKGRRGGRPQCTTQKAAPVKSRRGPLCFFPSRKERRWTPPARRAQGLPATAPASCLTRISSRALSPSTPSTLCLLRTGPLRPSSPFTYPAGNGRPGRRAAGRGCRSSSCAHLYGPVGRTAVRPYDLADVIPGLQQVGGEGVAQGGRRYPLSGPPP